MSTPVKYLWHFGDGRTSTEREPSKQYLMPGTYNAYCEITDNFGNAWVSNQLTVRVYDWSRSIDSGINAAYTDKCFRVAIEGRQGVGIVQWGGDNWVWPEARVGTCQGFDKANNAISLVLNNRNGKIYRVGVRELWTDRTTSYGGQEIPTWLKLRERVSRAGEFETVKHRESHIYIRPWLNEYKGAAGYNSAGHRSAQEVDLSIFVDGAVAANETIKDVPLKGDLSFTHKREGSRLQMQVATSSSAYRIIGVQQHIEEIDKKAPPPINTQSERVWQREFRAPDFWISRESANPLINRATGTVLDGEYDTLTTGPDELPMSAISFAAGQGLEIAPPALSGDFTLSVWVSAVAAYPATLWEMPTDAGGTMRARILNPGSVKQLEFADGVQTITQDLEWNGVDWALLSIERNAGRLRVFENYTQRGAHVLANAGLAYGGAGYLVNGAICAIFDARRVGRAVETEALEWYYRDVTERHGNGGLLPVMR